MSEYTDYLIYQTTATSLAELRAEVAAAAGPGTLIFAGPDGLLGPDGTATMLTGAPVWVALMSPRPTDRVAASGAKVANVFVLEDFASWEIVAHCGGKAPLRLFLGGPDGYGHEWFGYNVPGYTGLTTELTKDQVAALRTCFDLRGAQVEALFAYGRPWDFLDAIDAPAMQMADQGIRFLDPEAASLPPKFMWETAPEIYQ